MAELKCLLDTSTCIELLRRNERVRQRCVEHNPLCCISAVTAIEQLYGAYHAPTRFRQQELSKAQLLIDYYGIVGIDDIADAFQSNRRSEYRGLDAISIIVMWRDKERVIGSAASPVEEPLAGDVGRGFRSFSPHFITFSAKPQQISRNFRIFAPKC